MAIACTLDKPFNIAWIWEYTLGILECPNIFLNIVRKVVAFMFNYVIWKFISIQGYWLVTDILIGVLSLLFCQDMAQR